jgi:hypothetical protein
VLSAIFSAITENLQELAAALDPPIAPLQIGYAENWSEQGGAYRILMRPIRGLGGGPNLYTQNPQSQSTQPAMVRKVWTLCEFQCWGPPALPISPANQVYNTDAVETLRQMVIVAVNQAIPGGYKYQSEEWNTRAEVMENGRSITMRIALEQPITDLPFYDEFATIEAFVLTPDLETT